MQPYFGKDILKLQYMATDPFINFFQPQKGLIENFITFERGFRS